MSDGAPHDFIKDISDERSFSENWLPLTQFDQIYIPVGSSEGLSADPNNPQQVMEFIDVAHTQVAPGMRVAYVFTDKNRVDDDIVMARVPTIPALRRLFKNELLNGVTFNAQARTSDGDTEAYTLYRFALARLIGFLESHKQAAVGDRLSQAAQEAHLNDQMYSAFHLAACAREAQMNLDSYFSTELDVLLQLGLFKQAEQYFEWGKAADESTRTMFLARLQSLAGKPKLAIQTLKPFFLSSTIPARAWLERGRALLIDGQAEKAVSAFDHCLAMQTDHFDALLGKGIAIRSMHYESGDPEGLLQSLDCFQKVIRGGGYHTSEALHHAGTIHLALEEFEHAEIAFRETIARDPSPVSKRNLSLVLHAQGRFKEGFEQFEYLRRFFPNFAEGLEEYFTERPQSYTSPVIGPLTEELLSDRASEARNRLRQWGITMRDDILDFRRFDSYVSYYAPTGEFLKVSQLSQLTPNQRHEALLDCSLHLAATLVENGDAQWNIPESGALEDFSVVVQESNSPSTEWSLFRIIKKRVDEGADADNLTNMEMLVSVLPGYTELCKEYVDPFPALPADDYRIDHFTHRVERAYDAMADFGFDLTGELTDLSELEIAIESIFDRQGALHDAYKSGLIDGDFIADLGLYLGMLCKKFTRGVWYDHHDIFGVSLQEMPIANLYPVWRVTKRIKAGPGGDGLINLTTLEPPLVCSQLIRAVEDTELLTLDAVREALAEKLPAVIEEDPSQASLNRMAGMIWNYSGRSAGEKDG